MLAVKDMEGRPIGTTALGPDDDLVAAARKILRGKRSGDFWGAPPYLTRGI
jgi:hypothetical protein